MAVAAAVFCRERRIGRDCTASGGIGWTVSWQLRACVQLRACGALCAQGGSSLGMCGVAEGMYLCARTHILIGANLTHSHRDAYLPHLMKRRRIFSARGANLMSSSISRIYITRQRCRGFNQRRDGRLSELTLESGYESTTSLNRRRTRVQMWMHGPTCAEICTGAVHTP